jgi:hypothetical protein
MTLEKLRALIWGATTFCWLTPLVGLLMVLAVTTQSQILGIACLVAVLYLATLTRHCP